MAMLWDGIYFKLGEAEFFRAKMSEALVPASAGRNSHAHLTGTIVTHRWHPDFYYYFDSFLAAARSVDYVLRTIFGTDQKLWTWIKSLSSTEQRDRKNFQRRYDSLAKDFINHPLSHARNLSIHRNGLPSVEVTLNGKWGMTYSGGPLRAIPSTEQRPLVFSDDPMLPVGCMQSPDVPLEPCEDDFSITEALENTSTKNYKLFPASDEYLKLAQWLVEDTKVLANEVHESEPTPPPLYKL